VLKLIIEINFNYLNFSLSVKVASPTSACTSITSVGINDNILFKGVSIYPNPNQGIVNIDLGTLKDVSIKVINTNGQLIYDKNNINISEFQFKINTSPGVYFVEIEANNEMKKYKLVVE
jgi:hypothetical protein